MSEIEIIVGLEEEIAKLLFPFNNLYELDSWYGCPRSLTDRPYSKAVWLKIEEFIKQMSLAYALTSKYTYIREYKKYIEKRDS